ncbi:hypothetical protein HID58_039876 [Brassica napus]|uniref:Uncharacterized protein n=1 Tax=Brassica napus TaxID=3708 RepID=A0ABQ8BT93_BRANA|nr:hypothetical protein HID58_039876 [Brassica napus]
MTSLSSLFPFLKEAASLNLPRHEYLRRFALVVVIFPRERVASEIHLPARYAIHYTRRWYAASTSDGADELCVRLRPLIEIHISGTNRHACITCIVDAARDAY